MNNHNQQDVPQSLDRQPSVGGNLVEKTALEPADINNNRKIHICFKFIALFRTFPFIYGSCKNCIIKKRCKRYLESEFVEKK